MTYWGPLIVKTLVSAVLIVAISEIAKRSSTAGAFLASLPLTSLLAFVWLYLDTQDTPRIAQLSSQIFWLVIPSLVLFLVLPALLKLGWNFWLSLALASVATSAAYLATLPLLSKFGIEM